MNKIKHKNLLLIMIFVWLPLFSTGQGTEIEWFKTYGGLYLDEATSIQSTIDGGYLAVGYSYNSSTK